MVPRAASAGVIRIDATHEALQFTFVPKPPIEPLRIIDFIQKRRGARLAGPDRLRVDVKMPEWPERAKNAHDVLRILCA